VLCDSNPDEIVAIGAGVVAGIKTRNSEVKDLILSDICPFSLGVGIVGDVFSPIIERNQVLPCSKENLYVTARDMQEKIVLDVYQGENYTASMNLKLTTITLQIPRALAGEHGVYVRFSYDINGIFEIDVKGANKDSHIEYHESIINEHNGMSEEEIEEKKKLLNDIKISPREQNENKLVLETAYRLYEESNSEQRLQIEAAIHRFEKVLAVCSELEIKKELVRFAYFLAQIEQSKFKFKSIDDAFWDEQKESVQMNEAKDTKDTMKQNDTTDMDDLK
jgi:molecular chaperone HscC